MQWDEKHRRRCASDPDPIQRAHAHASLHRAAVTTSDRCGCFYCGSTFSPSEIEEWVDEVNGEGQTALCPRCNIDAVLGDRSGFPLDSRFLATMKAFWFS